MFDGTQLQSIPRVIDPRKFALHGVNIKGSVPLEELTRLADACLGIDKVTAELSFSLEERDRVVRGQIDAKVRVQCQRCLESADLHLVCKVNLAIAWSEDSAKSISESFDPWIVDSDEADLYSVLEDEILLNMPFVAYHDYGCVDVKLLGQVAEEELDESVERHETNPFQVLKLLKDKPEK